MRKRTSVEKNKVIQVIEKFKKDNKDFDFEGVKNVVSLYVEQSGIYENTSEFIKALSDKKVKEAEIEKLKYFLLNLKSEVIIGNSLDKDEMKTFLGYEHSSMTKYEGIHPYPYNSEGKIISKLYDDDDLQNPDKLSTLIYNNFLGKSLKVPASLKRHVDRKSFLDMLDFTDETFEHRINLQTLNNPFLELTKYPLETLSNKTISEILDHLRQPVKKSKRGAGNYPYYGANGKTGMIDNYLFDEKLVLIGEDGAKWGKGEPTAFLIEGKSWVNNHAHIIRTNSKMLLEEYLVLIFTRLDFSFLKTRPNGGKLQKGEMVKIKFPLPDIKEQQKIVKEVSKLTGHKKWEKFDELLK